MSQRILQRDFRRVRASSVFVVFLGCVIVAFSRLQIRMNARHEALRLGNALEKGDGLRAL